MFILKISPSVLTADMLELKNAIQTLEKSGADMLHLDVMDGNFVPNISFGIPVVDSIKKHSHIPCDVHLMIDKPHRYIEQFAKSADYLGFHLEAGSPVKETLLKIRELGCKSTLTIKPKTQPEEIFKYLDYCDMVLVMSVEPGFGGQKFMENSLLKLKVLKEEITRRNLNVLLEIDGGINNTTAPLAAKAGADVLVVGSYLFNSNDMTKTVKELKSL